MALCLQIIDNLIEDLQAANIKENIIKRCPMPHNRENSWRIPPEIFNHIRTIKLSDFDQAITNCPLKHTRHNYRGGIGHVLPVNAFKRYISNAFIESFNNSCNIMSTIKNTNLGIVINFLVQGYMRRENRYSKGVQMMVGSYCLVCHHTENDRFTVTPITPDSASSFDEPEFVEVRAPWLKIERNERRKLGIIVQRPVSYNENHEQLDEIWPDGVEEIWDAERELNTDEIPF